MNTKGTILVADSNVDSIALSDGKKEHAGYYLNEMMIPNLAWKLARTARPFSGMPSDIRRHRKLRCSPAP